MVVVPLGRMVPRDLAVNRASTATLVQMDLQVCQVQRVNKVLVVMLGERVMSVQLDLVVTKVSKASKELVVAMATAVRLGTKDRVVPGVRWESSEKLEEKETQGRLVLKGVKVWQDLKDTMETKVDKEPLAQQVPAATREK